MRILRNVVFTHEGMYTICARAFEGLKRASGTPLIPALLDTLLLGRWLQDDQNSVNHLWLNIETEVDTVSTNERPFQKKRKLKIAPGLSFQTIAKKQRK